MKRQLISISQVLLILEGLKRSDPAQLSLGDPWSHSIALLRLVFLPRTKEECFDSEQLVSRTFFSSQKG